MAFSTIHTKYGLTAMSRAESTGVPINLTHMAVGDGNGAPVTPDWEQTQLARERFRAAVSRVYQDPDDPTRFTVELVVPATEGGWVMREIGVFDAAGALFAVGNLPETYKPLPEEGSFGDAVLRLSFVVTNASVVTVMVDPNVAVASQAWIINNITAATLIPGGTVGQLLGKASNADGDYEWQDPDAINVTVDTIAERQLLAADQTIVDLAGTTTYGLAVYIDGLRIDLGSGAGEWQPDESLSTRLHLGQSYPAGTRITLVQNEPAGSAGAPLERSKNLSDVQDKATARSNLDIFSKDETRQMAPPGMVAHFARSTAPAGWLKANGAAVSREAYAGLFAAIGTTFGTGDGFTTFNLPDLRGEFVRGWDDGRGVDGGRELGAVQSGAIQSHTHAGSSADAGSHAHSGSAQQGGAHSHQASSGAAGAHSHTLRNYDYGGFGSGLLTASDAPAQTINTSSAGEHTHPISVGNAGDHTHTLSINSAGTHKHAVTIDAAGGAETRPRNVALLACIKF
ncbi:phage tail protein [Pseudomonas sp. AN-1]|uniref:phage tail-collar fiber domain-containing protein n=1 Tax=Pseudomonas sp. AN-1 TaxID=3096605 RepID=UPI002A6B182B|nr:phage tail protein [Pseudomonas sp. AN-1]WPP47700.1 phage tail protein [Pseudomonas sp. AN-1]